MSFFLENQLGLILSAFLAGTVGWLCILTRPARSRAWKLADFLWVVLGGFGAVAAVMAGLYRADTSRVDRQIDLAYASLRAFDRDAARFRLTWCDEVSGALLVLCEKVEFLSASTAQNGQLPLFIDVTRAATPLQSLRLFSGRGWGDANADMMAMADQASGFDDAMVLAFQTMDAPTVAALTSVAAAPGGRPQAADYRVLAMGYDELTQSVRQLKAEWDYLRANRIFLVIQVLALCLVAFAAPFRIGKSLADLRGP